METPADLIGGRFVRLANIGLTPIFCHVSQRPATPNRPSNAGGLSHE